MTDVAFWIIFGGLTGWLAGLIVDTKGHRQQAGNVCLGVLGALLGGSVMRALGGTGLTGFSIVGLLMAVLGALMLLTLIRIPRVKN